VGVSVVATIRAAAYEQFKAVGDLRGAGQDVVALAHLVRYPDRWDEKDRVGAVTSLAGHEDVLAALGRGVGVGEFLSAGPELVARLEMGAPPASGVAVVRAAVDWYRAGMTRPAPKELVRGLYPSYLPDDDAGLLGGFEQGLVWATGKVSGARIVTDRTDGTGLAVHDYVLDHLSTSLPAGLPTQIWPMLLTGLAGQPEDLFRVGATAYLTHHDPRTVETFFTLAAGAGHTRAMVGLGVLLEGRGDVQEAEEWYRKASDAGDTNAMVGLGVLLEGRGDVQEAEEWYRKAADAGNTDAMFSLGLLLVGRGDVREAEEWYGKAADAGHTDAMGNLGVLLKGRGDVQGAEGWYCKAADAGHTNAMFNLGLLLVGRGDVQEAEEWWRKAADAGHTDAMFSLGLLLVERGDVQGAEEWWRKAADAGHTDAMVNLGVLLKGRGDVQEAGGA
jgi:TPR repeat protein